MKTFPLASGQALTLSWSSFHVFFLFAVGWGARYVLATMTPQGWAQREITATQAAEIMGGKPDIPLWPRFGLPIAIATFLVLVTLANLVA